MPAKSVGRKSEKQWRDAIRKAVHQRVPTGDDKPKKIKALDRLANKLVTEGMGGNIMAIKEIGDRMDGKPAQAVEVAVAVEITRIERIIVDPLLTDEGQTIENDET